MNSLIEAVNTTAVQFHGQPIITAMVAGVAYVAMKPIVENIGIDWASQTAKLNKQKDKFGCCDITTPTKGGMQNMLFMPLRKLNGWLFSINPSKVRADIRDKLIAYQEECFSVLHDYWTKGQAVNPRKKSRDLRATHTITLTDEEFCNLCWLWNAGEYMREKMVAAYPALRILRSELAGGFYSAGVEYQRILDGAKKTLARETKSIKPDPHAIADSNWHRVLGRLRN